MAKKPMRISEILAKKARPPSGAGDANDFIAESQKLINQYSRDRVSDHRELSNGGLSADSISGPTIKVDPPTPFASEDLLKTTPEFPKPEDSRMNVATPVPALTPVSDPNSGMKEQQDQSPTIKFTNEVNDLGFEISVDPIGKAKIEEFLNDYVTVPVTESLKNSDQTTPEMISTAVSENPSDIAKISVEAKNSSVEIESKVNLPLNAPEASMQGAERTPSDDINNFDLGDSGALKSKRNSSVTKAEQFRNNSVTDSVTIPEQLRNSSVIITKQLRNDSVTKRNSSVTTPKQLRNNSGTDSVTHSVTITEQLRNDSVTTSVTPPHVNRLAGHKLSIVQTIFTYCQERGSTNSGPVSRESFESKTGIEGEVIRVTCSRLVKEGYIKVLESKRGNGGFTIYELHPLTHSQLVSGYFRNSSVTKAEQFRNNSVTDSVTESVTSPSSKIDSKNNTNLTNITSTSVVTEHHWFKELDFTKVAPIHPMLVNSTIRNLVHEKLTADAVQNFINRFTSWMATQSRISNPIGMFCERLKEFANEQDSPVLACMTEEEREIEAQFAAQVEKARAEMELIRKAREQNKHKDAEIQFEKWYQTATEQDMAQIFPPTAMAKIGTGQYKLGLKAVFIEKHLQD